MRSDSDLHEPRTDAEQSETGDDLRVSYESRMMQRAFRYRLAPTAVQAETLAQFAGAVRFVYNLALEQRRDFWRQYRAATGHSLNFITQGHQVAALRAEVPWLAAVHCTPLTQALRDLDRAFANFWAGRAGFPTPRRKGENDSFRYSGVPLTVRRLNGKWSTARLPKIGWVKFRDTRPIRGRIVNATVGCKCGTWYVSFACEIEHEIPANDLPAIGIDRGIANTLALSNGEMLSTPCTDALERRKRRAQRTLARRGRGSNRYRKQRGRVSRIAAKIARVRADWRHKASLSIAQRFGAVTVEALKIQNMTAASRGKRGLNRSILEQGWGAFERVLAYKLEERGGSLVKVNPAYTSQERSSCGVTDKASRESQASYVCRRCGSAIHADTNAALNILRRGTAFMRVEDAGYSADETRTINLAA